VTACKPLSKGAREALLGSRRSWLMPWRRYMTGYWWSDLMELQERGFLTVPPQKPIWLTRCGVHRYKWELKNGES
jgi:hypothetical protein